MATADEQLVSQPSKKLMFLARRSDLRLVRTPRYPRYGAAGQKVGEFHGEAIQFVDGRFDCPESGKITLEDGREADAAEWAEFLRSHRMNGDTAEGFLLVDPAAPPVSEAETDLLLEHSLDAVMLRRIIAQEEEGWNRDALLRPARKQLERVEEAERQMAEEREAAEAAAKGKAK